MVDLVAFSAGKERKTNDGFGGKRYDRFMALRKREYGDFTASNPQKKPLILLYISRPKEFDRYHQPLTISHRGQGGVLLAQSSYFLIVFLRRRMEYFFLFAIDTSCYLAAGQISSPTQR